MDNADKLVKDHHIPKPQSQEKVGWFLSNLTSFAVDSAVGVSFKVVNGGKEAYQIVQERLKNQTPMLCLNEEKKLEPVEEMQVQMEEMQGGTNNKTSVKLVEESKILEKKKIPNEGGFKGSDLPKTNQNRRFIRSRL